ncbi:MAG: PIN domain-containing protein [Treponema sp.]|nr:PIN domain-containing protein [Treponema sp.]MBP5753359.1 PIN domain-containing protein [Treponema sp.]MBR6154942.1 PIN domain-containing protein [Treponema sp.]
MILFDSNVLIDYWRKPKELLKLNITPDKFAICGVVKSELLHGARTNEEIDDILHFFHSFNLLHTDEYDFEGVGFMLQTLRENGVSVPFADVMIAFCAMKYDALLWTRDGHFRLIQGLYPELGFYFPRENDG